MDGRVSEARAAYADITGAALNSATVTWLKDSKSLEAEVRAKLAEGFVDTTEGLRWIKETLNIANRLENRLDDLGDLSHGAKSLHKCDAFEIKQLLIEENKKLLSRQATEKGNTTPLKRSSMKASTQHRGDNSRDPGEDTGAQDVSTHGQPKNANRPGKKERQSKSPIFASSLMPRNSPIRDR